MSKSYQVSDADVRSQNVTFEYDEVTGCVTIEIQGDSVDGQDAKFSLTYDIGAGPVAASTFSSPYASTQELDCSTRMKKFTIIWEAFEDLILDEYTDVDLALTIKDQLNVTEQIHTDTIDIDLLPPVLIAEPGAYGKDGTPYVVFLTPDLFREQHITPVVEIDSDPNFGSPTQYNSIEKWNGTSWDAGITTGFNAKSPIKLRTLITSAVTGTQYIRVVLTMGEPV